MKFDLEDAAGVDQPATVEDEMPEEGSMDANELIRRLTARLDVLEQKFEDSLRTDITPEGNPDAAESEDAMHEAGESADVEMSEMAGEDTESPDAGDDKMLAKRRAAAMLSKSLR